jgi:hypothetical protein
MNGKSLEIKSSGITRWNDKFRKLEVSAAFSVPKDAKSFDIVHSFQTYAPVRFVKLSFRNVSPSRLPITQKAGPISVTLEKAYFGNAPKGFVPYSRDNTKKFFVLVYSESGPPDNFQASLTLLPDGWSKDSLCPDPYWMISPNPPVFDESGKAFNTVYNTSSEFGGASEAFGREAERRTWQESLISRMNRQKASNMITNRSIRAAMSHNRNFRLVQFFDANHVPKRFTWEPEVGIPPVVKRRAAIVFKNVPIPPK